ncbi:MAG: hypothetical protein JWO38_7374 [Gemmataceae bacterium]|nr:hypothetical protein [Gemmataceae bacterium]
MALVLTGSWEQALLTATAQAAAPESGNRYLGRTALQKILYFLQISGVPMRYRFEIYHYGRTATGASGTWSCCPPTGC